MTIPSGTSYPKMPFGTDPITGKTTNFVFNAGQAKQFRYVVLNNAADEAAFDSTTAAPASGVVGVQENRHSTKGS